MLRASLLVRFIIAFSFLWLPLHSFDLWLYDHLFRFKPKSPASSQIVLLKISPGKLQQYLSSSDASVETWYPDLYQKLISKLSLFNPRLVVFTQVFTEEEKTFPRIQTKVPLVFSSSIDIEGKLLPPPDFLASEFPFGFNNLFLDSDNVFRSTRLVFSSE